MKLGEILIQKEIIASQQLEPVLAKQQECNKKLGELLVEEKLISPSDLNQALQEQYWRQNGYWVIGALDRQLRRSYDNYRSQQAAFAS